MLGFDCLVFVRITIAMQPLSSSFCAELFLLTIILELFPLHPQFFLLVACESCGGSLLRFARACPPLGSMPGSRVDSSGGWFFFLVIDRLVDAAMCSITYSLQGIRVKVKREA